MPQYTEVYTSTNSTGWTIVDCDLNSGTVQYVEEQPVRESQEEVTRRENELGLHLNNVDYLMWKERRDRT